MDNSDREALQELGLEWPDDLDTYDFTDSPTDPDEVADLANVSNKPWSDFSESDYTPEQWKRACLINVGSEGDDSKVNYKLPIREPSGTLNSNGIQAAAAALAGARGGVQASAEQKKAAARKLVSLYRNSLSKDPPEALLKLAGMQPTDSGRLEDNDVALANIGITPMEDEDMEPGDVSDLAIPKPPHPSSIKSVDDMLSKAESYLKTLREQAEKTSDANEKKKLDGLISLVEKELKIVRGLKGKSGGSSKDATNSSDGGSGVEPQEQYELHREAVRDLRPGETIMFGETPKVLRDVLTRGNSVTLVTAEGGRYAYHADFAMPVRHKVVKQGDGTGGGGAVAGRDTGAKETRGGVAVATARQQGENDGEAGREHIRKRNAATWNRWRPEAKAAYDEAYRKAKTGGGKARHPVASGGSYVPKQMSRVAKGAPLGMELGYPGPAPSRAADLAAGAGAKAPKPGAKVTWEDDDGTSHTGTLVRYEGGDGPPTAVVKNEEGNEVKIKAGRLKPANGGGNSSGGEDDKKGRPFSQPVGTATGAIDFSGAATAEAPTIEVFQLPVDMNAAIALGGKKWRKHLLPVGMIKHGEKVLDFSEGVLRKIINSFKAKPFDYVPVNLATEKNEHNEDPERFIGQLQDLELVTSGPKEHQGLYGIIETNDAGDRVLSNNPNVGTSPRYYVNYRRQHDGKDFGPTVRHVCVTQDPHITGLQPGEFMQLSRQDEDEGVIDMTNASVQYASGTSEQGGQAVFPQANPNGSGGEGVSAPESGSVDATQQMVDGIDFSNPEEIRGMFGYLVQELELTRQERDRAQQETQERVTNLTAATRHQQVTNEIRDFASKGVPPSILRKARHFLEGERADEQMQYAELSRNQDGTWSQNEVNTTPADLMRNILRDMVGTVKVGREIGSSNVTPVTQRQDARQSADAEYGQLLALSGVQNPKGLHPDQ